MKVLMVINTLPPTDLSGVGEQVVQLAEGLRARGHGVELLGRGRKGAPGPKLLFPLTVLPAVVRACRRYRPDVVQVHESDGGLAAVVVRALAVEAARQPRLIGLLQVSYVEEMRAVRSIRWAGQCLGSPSVHEWLFRLFKAPLQIVLGWLTGWTADLILAPSRQTARELERDYRLDEVEVVQNATSPLAEPATNLHPRVPDGGFFLFVGRLRIRKGVEVLLHAIRRLSVEHADHRLVIVGDGEHRSRLEATSKRLGLGERVVFTGRLGRADVARMMCEATALIVPSTYEGMPLVILEAMSRSLPVVASRVSGIPEVVREGETGWLFDAGDVEALTRILTSVLSEPEEARRRGENGLRHVGGAASPEVAVGQWLSIVEGKWPELAAADTETGSGDPLR